MKTLLLLIPLLTLLTAFGWMEREDSSLSPGEEQAQFEGALNTETIRADTIEFDQEQVLARLREEIKGMEDRPSAEVYQNIEVFKKVPAGRLLRIMEFGFSRSLGVNCTHCHNPENFAEEDKPQKEITRQMMEMVGTINSELLAKIENLESEKPTVNCTT
ncbi:MAG: photosynthetic reaction center cytochrome c subunit family protein, partial [Balneolaceae bacterium]|nr:photosynthetic reaction center cytochrome c subunit family protein [Balneolaceae bacterium]